MYDMMCTMLYDSTYQKKYVVVDNEGLSGDPAKIGYVRTHHLIAHRRRHPPIIVV
jgi:hypothetical protein